MKGVPTFARVVTVQTAVDNFAHLLTASEERLPAEREAPGFEGFYLLTDRHSGKLMTISLWETAEDLAQVEARAARVRSQTTTGIGINAPTVEIFEVELRA